MNFENFHMIDSIIAYKAESQTLICQTTVPTAASILDAHFPGFPILPGVLLIETMAQAAGMLLVMQENFEKLAVLFGVEKARFRDYAKPGEQLIVHATITHLGHGYGVCDGQILRDNKVIAQAEVRARTLIPNAEIQLFLSQQKEQFDLLCKKGENVS